MPGPTLERAAAPCKNQSGARWIIHGVDFVLVGVAIIAGLATFLSPCILPVLPVLFAASAGGGRRRPLGVATGLAVAFVVFTLTASRLLSALGLPQDLLRDLAIAMLAVVGIALLVPQVGEWIGRLLAPIANAAHTRLPGGDGFWSGVGLGAGLALVWTPCAGPILAAVTTLAAERRLSPLLVAITCGYAFGATLPMFLLALIGNRAAEPLWRVRRTGPALRRLSGAVLIGAAVLFTTDIPTQLAAATPDYVSSLQGTERTSSVADELRDLTAARGARAAVAAGSSADVLRDYGPAPDFRGITAWINTPGDRPLTLAGLRGKVVLIDFWTYSCVNCVRTFPYLRAWYERYHRAGLEIVGVHTPEFAFEHIVSNVSRAVGEHGLRYPVAVDNDYGTWEAWGNQYWPAHYLIDRAGHVRDAHFGEGGYAETEAAIRTLLGQKGGSPVEPAGAITASGDVRTPETYLGTYRANAYHQSILKDREADYRAPAHVPSNTVALAGSWRVGTHSIVAGPGARLRFTYIAPRIYVVAAPPDGRTVHLSVRVDGRRLPDVDVPNDDLRQVASLGSAGPHRLELGVPAGTALYSFTFG
jgi:cytochrome c biogenesis protein CcdA/thiol-disulfide isomerase/thioredoxin